MAKTDNRHAEMKTERTVSITVILAFEHRRRDGAHVPSYQSRVAPPKFRPLPPSLFRHSLSHPDEINERIATTAIGDIT